MSTPVEDTKKELRRIFSRHVEPDPDQDSEDPELLLLLKYKVRPGSRLRTLHKAKADAAADIARLEAKIADAQGELYQLEAEHIARWHNPTLDTELPSDAESAAYASAKSRGELIRRLSDAWKGMLEGYQHKGADAGRAWDGAYASWKNLIFQLYGDERAAPAWRTRDWERPSASDTWQLEQLRAQLEA